MKAPRWSGTRAQGWSGIRAPRWSGVCTGIGSVLLLLGIMAGLVNHNILDGPRFASHVDAVLRDPAVSRQVGEAVTRQVLAADPNLVAVRPLIEAAATSLAGSPAFSRVVQASAQQAHRAFTDENPGQLVLRLADVGAVLAGVLPVLSPQAATHVPAGLSVTLAQVGQHSFAGRTISLTSTVATLAWLLPLLALLAFAVGLWLAGDRLRAAARTGWGVVAAGGGLGLLALAGSIIARQADEGTLSGALVAAGWRELGDVVWWAAIITTCSGALIAGAAAGRLPDLDLASGARRIWAWIVNRPDRPVARVVRGLALAIVGAGAVLNPTFVFGLLAVIAGLILLIVGVAEIAGAAGAGAVRPAAATPRRTRVRRTPARRGKA